MDTSSTPPAGTSEADATFTARRQALEKSLHRATDSVETLCGLGEVSRAEADALKEQLRGAYRRDLELARLSYDTGWYAWAGPTVSLVYARKLRSTPPKVVRAADLPSLRAAIEDAERT